MAEVIWTEPALQQLEDILDYIAIENTQAAGQLANKVFETVSRLETFPLSGHSPAELPDSNYVEITLPPLRVFYKVLDGNSHILFVMRQEQELRQFLLKQLR